MERTEDTPPLVSVCMITYNHESFIEGAIRSVMTQKTDFPFELVIGEDHSTDKTLAVCRKLESEFPAKIRIITSEKNVGMQRNFIRTLQACRGKYIAILDGDDYWTDTGKLAIQTAYLETHPETAITFHRAKIEYPEGVQAFYPDINADTKETSFLEDIITRNYIHSSTCMFRAGVVERLPAWFALAYPSDWPLHILSAQNGNIHFSPAEMAVYRVHTNSLHSSATGLQRSCKVLPLFHYLEEHFRGRDDQAASWFRTTYLNQRAELLGLMNTENASRLSRFGLLMKTAFLLPSVTYFFRAFIVLFRPGYYRGNNSLYA